jgi:hypothetical protein
LLLLLLGVACGPEPSTPKPTLHGHTVRGTATAGLAAYFGSTPPVSRRVAAVALAWTPIAPPGDPACGAAYATLFARLPPDRDVDADGVPDLNLTSTAGVITWNVDPLATGVPSLNVLGADRVIDRDANCDGVADVDLDTDGDGFPDRLVDVDGDGIGDYSLVSVDLVSLPHTTLRLTSRSSDQVLEATANAEGLLAIHGAPTGWYTVELRSQAGDGGWLWAWAGSIQVSRDIDLGTIRLHREPRITWVKAGGETLVNCCFGPYVSLTYPATMTAGSTLAVEVHAEDPNARPLTVEARINAAAIGYLPLAVEEGRMSYTFSADDLLSPSWRILGEVLGGGGVDWPVLNLEIPTDYAHPVVPAIDGVTVDGVLFPNPSPATGGGISKEALRVAPVSPGSVLVLEVIHAPAPALMLVSGMDWRTAGPGPGLASASGDRATIDTTNYPVYAMDVNYLLGTELDPSTGRFMTITVPIDHGKQPARVTGLLIDGLTPSSRVWRVGQTVTVTVLGADPLGLPLRYSITGGQAAWTPQVAEGTFQYTFVAADNSASTAFRACVENGDGVLTEFFGSEDDCQIFKVPVME